MIGGGGAVRHLLDFCTTPFRSLVNDGNVYFKMDIRGYSNVGARGIKITTSSNNGQQDRGFGGLGAKLKDDTPCERSKQKAFATTHSKQPQQSCARVSDWPISIHNWVYIFPSVEFSIHVLTFYILKSVRRKVLT